MALVDHLYIKLGGSNKNGVIN